jgi:hypothetical protein
VVSKLQGRHVEICVVEYPKLRSPLAAEGLVNPTPCVCLYQGTTSVVPPLAKMIICALDSAVRPSGFPNSGAKVQSLANPAVAGHAGENPAAIGNYVV